MSWDSHLILSLHTGTPDSCTFELRLNYTTGFSVSFIEKKFLIVIKVNIDFLTLCIVILVLYLRSHQCSLKNIFLKGFLKSTILQDQGEQKRSNYKILETGKQAEELNDFSDLRKVGKVKSQPIHVVESQRLGNYRH